MFWRLTNQDFNIRLVDVKNKKYNDLLAGVSFPLSSRAPSVSLVPKLPFPSLQTPATQAIFFVEAHHLETWSEKLFSHFHPHNLSLSIQEHISL